MAVAPLIKQIIKKDYIDPRFVWTVEFDKHKQMHLITVAWYNYRVAYRLFLAEVRKFDGIPENFVRRIMAHLHYEINRLCERYSE